MNRLEITRQVWDNKDRMKTRTKTFKVNRNIEIVCEAKRTRNGFKHTATLFYRNGKTGANWTDPKRESVKCNYLNRTWEGYEFESVLQKLLEEITSLSDGQKRTIRKFIKNGERVEDDLKPLKTIAAVAQLGELFADSQKAKNDWKIRMLKAGLEGKGLIMPEDWDELDEDDKEKRLDSVIKHL